MVMAFAWPASPSRALWILISSTGLSLLSVRTASSLLTVCMPDETRPKIVCLPSRKGVGACGQMPTLRYLLVNVSTYASDEKL